MSEITSLKKGDEGAFEQVYYQHHRKLFGFFVKRLDHVEDAKELTQETFIKLWKSRHTLSAAHTLDTQLFTMAGSVLIDHFRKTAKPTSVMAEEEVLSPAGAIESRDFLQVAFRKLSPVRKRVLQLKLSADFSNKEIASRLAISEKTVEDHVTKGFRYIRSVC